MAACLDSGLTPRRSLEVAGAKSHSQKLREIAGMALNRCDQGMPLSEALAPAARVFPYYFLPVIRAGEAGGRLVEAFRLLERHCRRTEPTLKLLRNTWLYPLLIIVFGWILRTAIFIYFGKDAAAWAFLGHVLCTALLGALLAWILFKFSPVKWVVDRVLLQIPFLRQIEIRLAVILFFSTFRLAYEAGGLGVVTMLELASKTVRNSAIRQDLLKARPILEQNGTFGDAFGTPTLLDDDIKALINTGSISGKLDQCLAKIVEKATHQIEVQLNLLNQFLQRVVAFCVAMSIVETILVCILF